MKTAAIDETGTDDADVAVADVGATTINFCEPDELVTSLWWGLGTTVCVAPLAASVWTPNRSPFFYPSLIGAALLGGVLGLQWWRHRSTDGFVGSDRRPSPAWVVATLYPISVAIAIGHDQAQTRSDASAVWALTGLTIIGVVAVVLRYRVRQPRPAFRRGAAVWSVVSVALLPAYGLGLFVAPLAVSYYLAGRKPATAQTSPAVTIATD